jgi:hypothetical protein
MPPRATPRLCAHCGNDLATDEERVTLEDSRTGELLLLHRACFEAQFSRVSCGDDLDESS